jgi:hypothetical protein
MLLRRLASVFPLLVIGMMWIGGCAAQPVTLRPSIWPPSLSGRQYSAFKGLVIYARNPADAERNARHIVDVEREFTRNTGQQPMNGLVIINDITDNRIGNVDLDSLMPDEKREPQLIEMGFTMQEFVLAMGLQVPKEQFNGDPVFKPAALQTVQWVVSIPSQKRVEKFTDHLIDAGLKRQHFNFFQRMLIMPFMPLIHSLINDAMSAERDAAIYGCFCNAQTSWSEDRREKEAQIYAERRMGIVVNSLKAATQQVSREREN